MKNQKFNLFGSIWLIKYIDQVFNESGRYFFGLTDHTKRIIFVSLQDNEGNPLPINEIKITVNHELIHAILDTGQFRDEANNEPLVEFLARSILLLNSKNILQ